MELGLGATFRTVLSVALVLLCSGEVIGSLRDLQSLNVDASAEKEKQKAEVKHILQQKQRALSDLFKMLAEIGESLIFITTQKNWRPSCTAVKLFRTCAAVPPRSVVP